MQGVVDFAYLGNSSHQKTSLPPLPTDVPIGIGAPSASIGGPLLPGCRAHVHSPNKAARMKSNVHAVDLVGRREYPDFRQRVFRYEGEALDENKLSSLEESKLQDSRR
jgi:hypothetical protein